MEVCVRHVQILIADDQPELRRLLRIMLSRPEGWNVVVAADGEEAVQLFLEHDFDLVVLDQRMPKLTGTDAARRLRDAGFEGPIVLFSAYLEDDLEHAAQQLGLLTVPKGEISRLLDVASAALNPTP
jgi:CheY-like chemotaxis protein